MLGLAARAFWACLDPNSQLVLLDGWRRSGVGGRREQAQIHPKTPVPDGKRAAATNRWVSVGFGAGASVPRRAHAPEGDYDGTILLTKGGRTTLVGARRRRHELAHHDGIRVPGDFGIDFFEAELPVQVVGRLVVPDAC